MEKVRVFISSTSKDLQAERQAVEAITKRMSIPFVAMEYFGSDHRAPIDVCLQSVHQCSIYIGIIGLRYGSLAPESTLSFTECEYHEATRAGLPRLIYLKSKEARVPFDTFDSDPDNRKRLDMFREFLEVNHVVSYFTDDMELASMVAADLHRLLSHREERISIVAETDLLQIPRVMIKRAEMALLSANQFVDQIYGLEKKHALSRIEGQKKTLRFLKRYRFRFDGQFTVFGSDMTTVFHDLEYMIGQPFRFTDVNFDPLFKTLLSKKEGGTLKWIDRLSSDYLIANDIFYSPVDEKEWIRFNIAPFSYFEPWDWHMFVEAHNEIHALNKDAVKDIIAEFEEKEWLIV